MSSSRDAGIESGAVSQTSPSANEKSRWESQYKSLLTGLQTPLSSLGINGDSNIIDSFAVIIDQNLQAFRYGLYGMGLLGTVIVFRSIRFASKFTSPEKVPNSFLKKGVALRGIVKSISTDGTLHVDHIPIVKMPWHSSTPDKLLPLTLLGAKPTISGVYWMKLRLDDKTIWFKSLKRDAESLHSIIYAKKSMISSECINLKVLEEGVAHFYQPSSLPRLHQKTLKEYNQYLQKARQASESAIKSSKGMYDMELPPANRLQAIKQTLSRLWNRLPSIRGRK